ncbi:transcriptional regulator [Saccharibacillus sp. O23]|uniref:ArsR/SmtB family transcription factor n=1 Tax=Saccharibacillus sp. O23 TaxID=2009338 RepID=UPI000B4E553B|nr:metalloregulator ArsR/SmtB family transcription factor [Saccharibacillus sp. O23]OWR29972.1 transcriptional regulator [Saccharibacillus sp. O23]
MGAPEHDIFQAIADPSRRAMLKLLAEGELPIAAIAERFPISRTAVNKHLHVLANAGLVDSRRVGRQTRYRLRVEPLKQIGDWLSFFEGYWDDKLSALREWVEEEERS